MCNSSSIYDDEIKEQSRKTCWKSSRSRKEAENCRYNERKQQSAHHTTASYSWASPSASADPAKIQPPPANSNSFNSSSHVNFAAINLRARAKRRSQPLATNCTTLHVVRTGQAPRTDWPLTWTQLILSVLEFCLGNQFWVWLRRFFDWLKSAD